MAGFRFKKASEIISSLTDTTLVNTNKVNDFTEGSILKTLYEAFATELETYYYLTTENIKAGVYGSIYEAFGFERQQAKKAYGDITVYFSSALAYDYTIPKGAKVTSSNTAYDQVYETLDEYTVPAGRTSARFPVYCTTSGVHGNIISGVLDTITNISNIQLVTNQQAFQTGKDVETLENVRIRFRQYIQSLQRGTVQAIEYGAKTVDGVEGAYVDESVGYVKVYVHDANGDLPSDLYQRVTDTILGTETQTGYAPAGVLTRVFPVHKSLVNLYIDLVVPETALQTKEFSENVRTRLTGYINSFGVKDSIYVSDIIQQVMDTNDSGVKDTVVNLNVFPASDLRSGVRVTNSNSIQLGKYRVPKSRLQYLDLSHDESYLQTPTGDRDGTQESPLRAIGSDTAIDTGNIIDIPDKAVNSADDVINDDDAGIHISRKYATKPNEILKVNEIIVTFITGNER